MMISYLVMSFLLILGVANAAEDKADKRHEVPHDHIKFTKHIKKPHKTSVFYEDNGKFTVVVTEDNKKKSEYLAHVPEDLKARTIDDIDGFIQGGGKVVLDILPGTKHDYWLKLINKGLLGGSPTAAIVTAVTIGASLTAAILWYLIKTYRPCRRKKPRKDSDKPLVPTGGGGSGGMSPTSRDIEEPKAWDHIPRIDALGREIPDMVREAAFFSTKMVESCTARIKEINQKIKRDNEKIKHHQKELAAIEDKRKAYSLPVQLSNPDMFKEEIRHHESQLEILRESLVKSQHCLDNLTKYRALTLDSLVDKYWTYTNREQTAKCVNFFCNLAHYSSSILKLDRITGFPCDRK